MRQLNVLIEANGISHKRKKNKKGGGGMRTIKQIPLNAIAIDRYPCTVQTLDLAMKVHAKSLNMNSLPPVHLVKGPYGYQLLDGRHRYLAAKLNGRLTIKARFAEVAE